MKKLRYGLLLAALIICQIFIFHEPAEAAECKDIKVIFADGSGAKIGGTDNNYLDYKNAVSAELKKTGLSFDFYELGVSKHGGFQYPAKGIGLENMQTILTSIGAFFSAGESYSYGESVDQGVGELRAFVQEVSAECPNTKFVLSGFSQGGGVISEAITKMDSKNIIYVATFGDAKLYLPEGAGVNPLACQGKNLSPYREYVPDCHVFEGILGGRNPYQPSNFGGKLGVWCNYHDVVCSSQINWLNLSESLDPHGSYGNSYNADHLFEKAAAKIYQKVLAEFGTGTKETVSTQNVAILIDSTSSMSSLIKTYKQEAARLAEEVLGNGGKVALYEYRDVADSSFLSKLHCDFETCTLEKFQSELDKISTAGGGDVLESVLAASLNAMNELKWQYGATKSIVILTDAGYHPSELFKGQRITLKTVVERSLEIDPVNFYVITSEKSLSAYSELTAATGGKAFSSARELAFSTDFILKRPDVKLSAETYRGEAGDAIFFDASSTISEAEITKFEWDLDCDGEFEEQTTEPFVAKIFKEQTEGTIQVKVTDKNGLFGTMSAKVKIDSQNSEGETPEIQELYFEKVDETKVVVKFKTNAFRTIVFLNDTMIGVTDEQEIEISDIDFQKENVVSLIPYGQSGYPGEKKSLDLDKTSAEFEAKEEVFVPKAPNCGAR